MLARGLSISVLYGNGAVHNQAGLRTRDINF